MKKSNCLNESLSNKNYFLNTYNKMMNTFSPQKIINNNLTSKPLTKTKSAIKNKTSDIKKTSRSINLKVSNFNQSINQKNPTINLYNPQKYKITNYMIYKSPRGKEGNCKIFSSSREKRKTNYSLKK